MTLLWHPKLSSISSLPHLTQEQWRLHKQLSGTATAPPAARDLTSNTEGKRKPTTKVDRNQLRSSPPLKILVGNHYFPILKILGGVGWGEKPLPEPAEKQILELLECENTATQGNYLLRSSWRISKRTSPSSHSLYIGQELEGWYSSTPAHQHNGHAKTLQQMEISHWGLTVLDKSRWWKFKGCVSAMTAQIQLDWKLPWQTKHSLS